MLEEPSMNKECSGVPVREKCISWGALEVETFFFGLCCFNKGFWVTSAVRSCIRLVFRHGLDGLETRCSPEDKHLKFIPQLRCINGVGEAENQF